MSANEVKPSENDFVFPELHCGMAVDVAWTVGFSKPRLGIVCKPKTRSASILVWTEDGPLLYSDCRHRTDPRILTNPEWLVEDARNRAIFQVSEVERRRMRSDDTLTRAMALLDGMAQDIASLKKAVFGGSEAKRGPGRPPKQQIEPELAEV